MLDLFKKLRPFLLIIMLLMVGLGMYSFKSMPKESSPAINIPFFSITAVYPGADPKSVEEQVTQKIEDKITSVSNVSTFDSVSSNNVSALTVQFKRGSDENTAYNDLKSALDEVKVDLPEGVDIRLKKTDLTDMPVYTFSIAGNLYPSQLYDKVRFLEDDLKRISGVDRVDIIGKYIPQVQIKFDYDALKKYKLSLQNILGLVSQSIDKKPVDKKELNGLLYSFEVRTYQLSGNTVLEKLANFKTDLENTPLINQNGNILRLKDIASVYVTHPFYKKESYVNGKSAITYMVYKTSGTDILDLVSRLEEYLKTKEDYFQKNNLENVEIFTRTAEVNKTFDTFTSNFRQTTIIILIIIGLFIGLKEAVGIFLAFPIVYLVTFILLKGIGYTFNSIVSFSLVLTLGIMVDNLIVIIEGFEEGIKNGLDKYEAIAFAIKTYRKPLMAGNFTTIAMFFPLNFMLSGRIGEFMKYLPTTVDSTLIFSMIVAFVFLPLILTYLYKGDKKDLQKEFKKEENKVEKDNKVVSGFMKLVTKALKKPKKVIIGFWLLFIISTVAFVKLGNVDFMPATDKNNVYVNIIYDKSINLEENKKITEKINNYIQDFFVNCSWYDKDYTCDKIVKNIQIKIGDFQTFSPLDKVIYNNSFNPDLTTFDIALTDTDDRAEKDNAVKIYPALSSYLLAKVPEFNGKVKDISVFIKKNGPSSGKDVGFYIKVKNEITESQNNRITKNNLTNSPNLPDLTDGNKEKQIKNQSTKSLKNSQISKKSEIEILAKAYEEILPQLKKIPLTYSWTSSLEYTNGKIDIIYDLDKIKQFNLSLSDVNTFLLSFYNSNWSYEGGGVPVSKLTDFGKDIIPVTAYTIVNGQDNGLNLNSILIPGTNIYLSQVVKQIKINPEVKYYKHQDGKLVLKIEAYKQPQATLGPITTEINKILDAQPDIELSYASDVKDMKQSMKDLGSAFIIGMFLMFSVLVLNFGNYRYPLIVFTIIPLLFIGAFWLLIIFNIPFGFAAQLGMFGLIGVGVNDAILLIERYNELLGQMNSNALQVNNEKGIINKDKILYDTIKSRLKPVFLTTLTTVLGLITLALKDDLWGSLALSFMGGLLVGTMIILIYIPALLKLTEKE